MYIVMCLQEEVEVNINGIKQDVKLTWDDGMVGVLPVYDTKEEAVLFAGDKYQIIEIEQSEE